MRALPLAPVIALALAGCMLPVCGPTVYYLSGVAASAAFLDEEWDPARVEAGLRAAGFEPRVDSERHVTGTPRAGYPSASMTIAGGAQGAVATIAYVATAQGGREEVDARAEAVIAQRDPEARRAFDAFAAAANWTLDTPISWDHGILHGDC